MPRIITRDKAFHVIKSSKYDGYQRGPGSMVYKFFDIHTGKEINSENQWLAEEFHNADFKKFKNVADCWSYRYWINK